MGLSDSLPSICSALKTKKFQEECNIRLVNRTGPLVGSTTTFFYDLTQGPLPGRPTSTTTVSTINEDVLKIDLTKIGAPASLNDITNLMLKGVNDAKRSGSCLAEILLSRSVIEAVVLGLLLGRESEALEAGGKAVPKGSNGCARPIEDWKLEDMIRRAVVMELLDDTDESSLRTLQNYGNLVHPARVLRKKPFMDPPRDAVIVRTHLVKILERYGVIVE
jgi:hypothetical protein